MEFREGQPSYRLLILVVAAASLACCDPSSSRSPDDEAVPASATAVTPAPRALEPDGEPLLPGLEGSVIEIEGDRVTLRALRAPRVRLLQGLGERAGFEVIAGPIEPKEISVDLTAVRLPEAVGALLRDVPHALGYEPDPEAGAPRLTRVRVGSREHFAKRAQQRRSALAVLRERRARNAGARELAAKPGEGSKPRPREGGKDPAELEEQLRHGDPRLRAAALAEVRPHDEGLVLLRSVLAEDPDPRVRAAAANQLVGADSLGAVRSLLAALDDPDSEVVLAVIDTLEFWQDPSLVPDLEPLLDHPDAEVREAAGEAIDFLR